MTYMYGSLLDRDSFFICYPGWKGLRDAPVLYEVPLQTALLRGLPPSQQYDRRRTEHEGSSSPHAMEPSATGLQQARAWTATLVQHGNAFVVYFLAFVVDRGQWC